MAVDGTVLLVERERHTAHGARRYAAHCAEGPGRRAFAWSELTSPAHVGFTVVAATCCCWPRRGKCLPPTPDTPGAETPS